jgi:hypothetical protein
MPTSTVAFCGGLQIVAKLSKDLAAKLPNIKTTGQVTT